MFLLNMDLTLIIIVIIISFLQSIYGVGILLFGTPILLSLDYGFIESLNICYQIQKDTQIFFFLLYCTSLRLFLK